MICSPRSSDALADVFRRPSSWKRGAADNGMEQSRAQQRPGDVGWQQSAAPGDAFPDGGEGSMKREGKGLSDGCRSLELK